jgi:hypothetical protein
MHDMVAAAAQAGHEIKPRLITDWASVGLLDQPEPRGRGRGKGKSYTWPPEQARLLNTILDKRSKGVGRVALLNIPVSLWLIWGERYTPLRQARRALATWARATLQVGPEKAGRSIREILRRLDHPDATAADRLALRQVLEQIAFGQAYHGQDLIHRLRRVMDPHDTGLLRGLPDGAPLSPEIYAETIECRLEGGRRAVEGDLDDEIWLQARQIYLTQGPVAPFLAELHRPNPRGSLTPAAHERMEYALNGACQHLVQILGQLSLEDRPRTEQDRKQL